MKKTVIVGGAKMGKTTTANAMGGNVHHTDDTIPLGWDGAKHEVVRQISDPNVSTVEGVQAARGLRQWLRDNPTGKPCDEVIHLTTPKVELTPGQAQFNKGIETVIRGIIPELERRGVVIKREES